MSIFPVIVRELKAQARQPFTYWLRVLGGFSVAAAFGMALWTLHTIRDPSGNVGAQHLANAFGTALFGKVNLFMFLVIWLLVPLSTADAISRERREGTLALLFLTKLRSWGIVIGKSAAHTLRALSLFLTIAPWLVLPLLFGGVGPKDVAMALLLNFAALLLALAAGLLASTIPRDRLKSVILAELFALSLLLWMLHAHKTVLRHAMTAGLPPPPPITARFPVPPPNNLIQHLVGYSDGFLRRTLRLIAFTTNSSIETSYWYGWPTPARVMETHWQTIWTNLTPAGHRAWFGGTAFLAAQAAVILLIALAVAAWCVRRSWRDSAPNALLLRLKQSFLSPRFRIEALRRNLSRSLTANPIGWLQHYSPAARMVKWGWCLFILMAEIILSTSTTDLYDAQTGLGVVLLLGLGFSATGSFRNELETGAFELLLVTPLRERQIIFGRLRGLWTQFLPAIAIYGAGSLYLTSGWATTLYVLPAWMALAQTLVAFCMLPIVGLYFSVLRLNFFAAWICTCAAWLLPMVLGQVFRVAPHFIILVQLILGLVPGFLLERRLRNRGFLPRLRLISQRFQLNPCGQSRRICGIEL